MQAGVTTETAEFTCMLILHMKDVFERWRGDQDFIADVCADCIGEFLQVMPSVQPSHAAPDVLLSMCVFVSQMHMDSFQPKAFNTNLMVWIQPAPLQDWHGQLRRSWWHATSPLTRGGGREHFVAFLSLQWPTEWGILGPERKVFRGQVVLLLGSIALA